MRAAAYVCIYFLHTSYNAADQMIQTARLQQLIIQKGAGTRQDKRIKQRTVLFFTRNMILGFDLIQTFLSLTKFIKNSINIYISK